MSRHTLIIGQGLAGSVLAWQASWRGDHVTVLDAGFPGSASSVAAGLMMPLSGQRLVRRSDYEQLRDAAESCYRRIEQETGQRLFRSLTIERRFTSTAEREEWEQRSSKEPAADDCLLQPNRGRFGALQMHGGQLNIPLLLQVTRERLSVSGRFQQRQIDAADVQIEAGRVRIANSELEAERLFFCEGHRGRGNCWFPGQPDQPVRGELLRVRLNPQLPVDVVVGGVWAAPVPGAGAGAVPGAGAEDTTEYLIGATWDREQLVEGLVTEAGRAELLQGLAALLGDELHAEVLGQTSGIRAGTRQRQVLVRIHATHPQLGMLNGLGSWGALTAPSAAAAVLELQEACLRRSAEAAQSQPPQAPRRSLTQLAHSIARRAYRVGDRVFDATAGNGHDTRFLAALAGPSAVTAIDIQPQAISATRSRLGAVADAVTLLVGDHAAELERQAAASGSDPTNQPPYGVVMFNLGYLPGSDRSVITRADTTSRAIRAGLRLLRPGGVLTAIVYRGHPGGAVEYGAVEQLARELADIRVDVLAGDSADAASPVLFVFRSLLRG